MASRKRALLEPTDDWEQLQFQLDWMEQTRYELIRPVVVFGAPPVERAKQTGVSARTIYRRVGRFDEVMTAWRGFIGLAAMIFGNWMPFGGLGAALIFGFAESLQTRLAILSVPIPSQFLLMAPYIVTIIVLAGVVAPWTLMGPVSVAIFGLGWIMATAPARAFAAAAGSGGQAAAMLGFLQMAGGALGAQAVGLLHDGTAMPFAVVGVGCAVLAIAAHLLSLGARPRGTATGYDVRLAPIEETSTDRTK